jgi:hypothetical protein
MLYRIAQRSLCTAIVLVSTSAIADITIKNGTDINMLGSGGSTIVFPDGTSLGTAPSDGVDGIDGTTGDEGPQGIQGVPGEQGIQGIQGDPGDDLYDRVIVVRSGGTALENGTALKAALAGISTATDINRYVIKLDSGRFDLGTDALTMRSYIALDGSGLNSTIVQSANETVVTVPNTLDGRASISNLTLISVNLTGTSQVVKADSSLELFIVQVSGPDIGIAIDSDAAIQAEIFLTSCRINMLASGSTGIKVTSQFKAIRLFTNTVSIQAEVGSGNVGIELAGGFQDIAPNYLGSNGTSIYVDSTGTALHVDGTLGYQILDINRSFFSGGTALDYTAGSWVIIGNFTATSFTGTRSGFTDGSDAFFADCHAIVASVATPLLDTENAIAP